MRSYLLDLAKKHGFCRARAARRGGSTLLLLTWSYIPFKRGERIPAYYLASNKMYQAKLSLIEELREQGIAAEDADTSLKAEFIARGLASPCLNGLVAMDELGTRTILCGLSVNCDIGDERETDSQCGSKLNGGCDKCMACAKACPGGAIGPDGIDYSKCIRAGMNDTLHPITLANKLTTYMGCEVCQAVCHLNSHLGFAEPDEKTREAFELRRLLTGDTKEARLLVGKNKSGSGKLTAQAIAFASRDGGYESEIEGCLESPFEDVRRVAEFFRNKA